MGVRKHTPVWPRAWKIRLVEKRARNDSFGGHLTMGKLLLVHGHFRWPVLCLGGGAEFPDAAKLPCEDEDGLKSL